MTPAQLSSRLEAADRLQLQLLLLLLPLVNQNRLREGQLLIVGQIMELLTVEDGQLLPARGDAHAAALCIDTKQNSQGF